MKGKVVVADDGCKYAFFTGFDGEAEDALKQDSVLNFLNINSVKNASYFVDLPACLAGGDWQNI